MDNLVVVFTKNNARVMKNPADVAALVQHRMAILNPDMVHVKNIPPHFWKLEYGMVVPMTQEEQKQRLEDLKDGADNTVITPTIIDRDPGPTVKKQLDESVAYVKRLKEEYSGLSTKHQELQKDNIVLNNHIKDLARLTEEASSKFKFDLATQGFALSKFKTMFQITAILDVILFLTTIGAILYGTHVK